MRLDGFGLLVNDMATMIRFYRDILGFEILVNVGFCFRVGDDLEVVGGSDDIDQLFRLAIHRLVHDGNLGVADFGADGEAQQEHQHDRHSQHKKKGNLVPKNMDKLFFENGS